jgi:hypothetical protein
LLSWLWHYPPSPEHGRHWVCRINSITFWGKNSALQNRFHSPLENPAVHVISVMSKGLKTEGRGAFRAKHTGWWPETRVAKPSSPGTLGPPQVRGTRFYSCLGLSVPCNQESKRAWRENEVQARVPGQVNSASCQTPTWQEMPGGPLWCYTFPNLAHSSPHGTCTNTRLTSTTPVSLPGVSRGASFHFLFYLFPREEFSTLNCVTGNWLLYQWRFCT